MPFVFPVLVEVESDLSLLVLFHPFRDTSGLGIDALDKEAAAVPEARDRAGRFGRAFFREIGEEPVEVLSVVAGPGESVVGDGDLPEEVGEDVVVDDYRVVVCLGRSRGLASS